MRIHCGKVVKKLWGIGASELLFLLFYKILRENVCIGSKIKYVYKTQIYFNADIMYSKNIWMSLFFEHIHAYYMRIFDSKLLLYNSSTVPGVRKHLGSFSEFQKPPGSMHQLYFDNSIK